MAEGESLAANSLASQVIDFVGLEIHTSSNPAPKSELSEQTTKQEHVDHL